MISVKLGNDVNLSRRPLTLKEALRRIFALGFLVLLLAEWGSHGVITNASGAEGSAAYSKESGHDDPCQTLVRCSDSPRQNQHVLKLSHDASQHNGFVPKLSALGRTAGLHDGLRFAHSNQRALFRPPDPLFHPPELS